MDALIIGGDNRRLGCHGRTGRYRNARRR